MAAFRTSELIKQFAAAATFSASAVAQPVIEQLGPLGQRARIAGTDLCVSENGDVIAGSLSVQTSTPPFVATFPFRRINGQVQTLGSLGDRSYARAISADGTTTVGHSDFSQGVSRATRWTLSTGLVDLDPLYFYASHFGKSVSGDGSVVVGYYVNSFPNNAPLAFRWTSTTGMQPIGHLGGHLSVAWGVSRDGSVVVGYSRDAFDRDRAFRWTATAGMQRLDPIGDADFGYALGVSLDGNAIVGYSVDNHAFRWTQSGGIRDIHAHVDGMFSSFALATNDDGGVVVGVHSDSGSSRAMIWTESGGMASFRSYLASAGVNVDGWVFLAATAVSGDGSVVVGDAIRNGVGTGFAARGLPTLCRPHVSQPQSQYVCSSGAVTLSAAAVGPGVFSYQWHKNGVPLSNAANPSATSKMLTIASATQADAGQYVCAVTNACTTAYSDVGVVSVIDCSCPADFNRDGFVDDADFVLFSFTYGILDCRDPSMPNGCATDLNRDEFVDDADFVIFAAAYEALICP